MNVDQLKEHLEICPDWAPTDPRGTFLSLALAGEAGELANLFKKEWRDGFNAERRVKIIKEASDIVAYALMLANHLNVDLIDEAMKGILEFETRPEWPILLEKLRKRQEENVA